MARPFPSRFPLAWTLLLLLCPGGAALADEVRLKSGETIVGLVVNDNYRTVSIRVNGDLRTFKQAAVASVRFTPEGTEGAVHLGRGRMNPSVPPPAPPDDHFVYPTPTAKPLSAKSPPTPSAALRNAEVTIYGTSWCGYCASARDYFRKRGIPFTDRDIEKESGASAEIARKCRDNRMHFSGSVPVLDVNGTIIQGFDVPAIEAALGEKPGSP